MPFKTSSAICFNLDQSKILSSGRSNGLIKKRFSAILTISKSVAFSLLFSIEKSGDQDTGNVRLICL